MSHSSSDWSVNLRKRGPRYDREAEEAVQYPRRFVLFGPRVMPVSLFLRIEASKQHSYDKRLNRERGLRAQAQSELTRRARLAQKTQLYIDSLWERANLAAQQGVSAAGFLLQEQAAAAAHRRRPRA